MDAIKREQITRDVLREKLADPENTADDEKAIFRVLALMGEG